MDIIKEESAESVIDRRLGYLVEKQQKESIDLLDLMNYPSTFQLKKTFLSMS